MCDASNRRCDQDTHAWVANTQGCAAEHGLQLAVGDSDGNSPRHRDRNDGCRHKQCRPAVVYERAEHEPENEQCRNHRA
ncbi:hypothetical protein, partial [Ilumatobacter sp.]|uniref:hypothetical protein n=1 Tax=Ilumatobacter sp. TaxID=1967498 RepID=UPI003C64A777